MVTTCCVLGCTTRATTGSGIGFFRFPKHDPERCRQWIRAVRRRNWEPTDNDRLCGKHFLQGEPCHRYKNHPDWIPSLFSFTKRNRQLEARNLKRFERSQKRLRRFVVHATSSSAPSTMPSNSSSSSESSSKPSSIAPAQSCTVRGHFPTPPIPGMPTQAFVVNSDGSLGSTYTTTVKGPTFLLCNGSGTPRLVNQELETNQVVILLSPAGASPAAVAPTTTVMSNNTPIIHHIVTSTQLGPSELPRALPASGGSEQEKAAPQIRVTNVWSTASESTLSTSEEEDEPGVMREGDTDEQMSPLTEGSEPLMPGSEQLEMADTSAEASPQPRIVHVWSAASGSTVAASKGKEEPTNPIVSSMYSLDEPDYILPCTEMSNEGALSATSKAVQTVEDMMPCTSCQRLQEESKQLQEEVAMLTRKYEASQPL